MDTKTTLRWYKALDHDQLKEGRATTVLLGHTSVCMTRYEGAYAALTNRCPHQGLSLIHI